MRVVSGIDVDQDGAGRFLVYTFAATSGTGYARIDPLGVTSQTLLSTTTVLADIRTTADSYFITDASVDYVYRVPKGAHSMVDPSWIDDVAAPGVTYLAHEGSYVCWAETDGIDCNLFGVPSDTIDLGPDSTPGGIDIEGQTLYATLRNLGILERASFLDLTSFTVVATGLPTPTFGVTVRGAEAFVATPAGLHRVTIATGEVSSIAAADIAGGGTMASTVSAVYLADLGPQGGDGRLWRFRLDGGDAEVLYQAPGQVRSLVIEDQYVFFTADTAVYRRALAAPSFSDVAPGGG